MGGKRIEDYWIEYLKWCMSDLMLYEILILNHFCPFLFHDPLPLVFISSSPTLPNTPHFKHNPFTSPLKKLFPNIPTPPKEHQRPGRIQNFNSIALVIGLKNSVYYCFLQSIYNCSKSWIMDFLLWLIRAFC